jgi:hypothetical protein
MIGLGVSGKNRIPFGKINFKKMGFGTLPMLIFGAI